MTLLPFSEVPSLSYGEQPSKNILIEGDNLKVLAVLPPESIDLIYIDPPYGTGKQFRYNDDWKHYAPHTEEVYVTEQEVGCRAPWINFIASRLYKMKRVLKPSGVIAVSIGKEQLFYLGVLMDAIFGEHNQLGIINWHSLYGVAHVSFHVFFTRTC